MGFDMDDIDFGGEVPKNHKPMIEIISPRANQRMEAVSLSSRPILTRTHHFRGRTIPHLRDAKECAGCRAKLSIRYKGYLAGLYGSKLRLIEFTHQAWIDNAFILEDEAVDLRGKRIVLSRGKSPRGAVRMSIEERPIKFADEVLPMSFDVKAALLRIWNGESRNPTEDQDGIEVHTSIA